MDDLLWIDAQKIIDLAIAVTVVVTVGLIVLQAAYLLLLALVLWRTKRSAREQ